MRPIETKSYSDGTTAIGVKPLPDLSPKQQKAMECRWCGKGPLVWWNDSWRHADAQDQKQCETPVPFAAAQKENGNGN